MPCRWFSCALILPAMLLCVNLVMKPLAPGCLFLFFADIEVIITGVLLRCWGESEGSFLEGRHFSLIFDVGFIYDVNWSWM